MNDAHEIFLQVHPEDIAYIQAVFESYEGVGIIRTVLRQAQHSEPGQTVDRKKAVIVLMVVDDFLDTARSILTSLKNEVPLIEIPRPADIGEDWLLKELATNHGSRIED